MCLGESTTVGQYPSFLQEVLNQRNIAIKFSVIDKGICGANTSYIVDNLESDLDAYHPDMVITMMGINDWGPHIPYEVVSDSKAINFLKSFRTYKLTRLLWLHIVTRLIPRGELHKVYKEEKATELNPKNDMAYLELGRVYRDLGKHS